MEARLHVISVHAAGGPPHQPIVATLAHTHSSDWRLGHLFSLGVLVCLALLGLGRLQDMLPQSEVLEAPGVGCRVPMMRSDDVAPVLLPHLQPTHTRTYW